VAFPTVVNTANTTSTTSGSLALTMPASIVAGMLLLALSGDSAADSATTAMTGWTKVGGTDNTGSLTVFAKIAAGSDTGTVTGTTAARAVTTYLISGWSGLVSDIKIALATPATNADVDPPSLTPGLGALDYLWIEATRNRNAVTAASTNYTNLLVATSGATLSTSSAIRQLNASTEDPGATTPAASASACVTATIAIPPVAASSSPQLRQTPLAPRLRSFNW